MFTKNGIRTLVDVIIADPTQVNLLLQSCATQGFDASNVAQAKEWSYHNQHLVNQFLPLSVELFGCLYKQVDVFLHNFANAIWNLKGLDGPFFFFYLSYFSLTKKFIQKLQASSIFSRVITVSLATSQLPPNFHPFRTHLASP